MSTKRFLEITQSTTIPIPVWLILGGVAGIFTLSWRIHEWESQLEDVTKAANEAWTIPMEREAWYSFQAINADPYPKIKVPSVMQIFRDN